MNTYEQQANDFLEKTGAKLTIVFDRHGKHFDNDTETRDIYNVTIERSTRKYSFKFGQCIAHSGNWLAQDKTKSGKFTKAFHTKEAAYAHANKFPPSAVIKNPDKKQPTAYDILACLTKYDPGTFENFCSEFGYDTDSRKAEKTYNAVRDEYLKLCVLFNSQEMELLAEIQ